MAAGLGFKTFNTGDVLSAADVNGYLMQGVLVFADATARDAAITSPQEGQFAYTKNNDSLWYYSGSAWVASGATGDIEGVTAGTGISGGGTSGTVTITNSMATAIDAKGDLIVGTGADTFSRLAVGTNGYTLVADSAEATGLKWAAASGGGTATLITSASFSGQSSVAINGCFTSTYTDYYVMWYARGSVANADFEMQFQYSTSTTETATYYGAGFKYDRGNTLGTYGYQNTSAATIYPSLNSGDSQQSFGIINFVDVGTASAYPSFYGNGYGHQGTENINYAGFNDTTRLYTGLLFKPSSGTITGRYKVYGVNN